MMEFRFPKILSWAVIVDTVNRKTGEHSGQENINCTRVDAFG